MLFNQLGGFPPLIEMHKGNSWLHHQSVTIDDLLDTESETIRLELQAERDIEKRMVKAEQSLFHFDWSALLAPFYHRPLRHATR